MGVATMANRKTLFVMLMDYANCLKHTQASFSLSLFDSLRLRVDQIPRCQDLAILVSMTDRQNQLLYHLHMLTGN